MSCYLIILLIAVDDVECAAWLHVEPLERIGFSITRHDAYPGIAFLIVLY